MLQLGMGAKLGERMWAIYFQPRCSTNWLLSKWCNIKNKLNLILKSIYKKNFTITIRNSEEKAQTLRDPFTDFELKSKFGFWSFQIQI